MMLLVGRPFAFRLLPVLVIAGVMLLGGARAATQPAAPVGATGMALDGRVELAWQPVSGADHYSVYRGTTPSSITSAVTPAGGVTETSFTDPSAGNGTAYYYAVRAVNAGTESTNSLIVQATPAAQSCSTGNAVVRENCYAGTAAWKLGFSPTVAGGGIEGFATSQSINHGESLGLKVNTAAGASYSAFVYRSGYYGGTGGRLYSVLTGLAGTAQPACTSAPTTTGLVDCSNWSVSATITTTTNWPSGAYLVRLVRNDNGAENHVLFVVRDDARTSDVLFGLPFSTYEAYNPYGGKSLYPFNSTGANTVAGNQQAVKVSFDRPFDYARIGGTHDWYTRADYPLVSWLERSGYDVAYQSDTDMELNGSRVQSHMAYVLGAHDEYYSAAMRTALEQARDGGVSLFNSGANAVYWKIRYENGPGGGQNRVLVCYKTTATGAQDPSGIPTGTWRDPAGANKPENALLGVMYVGDNSSSFFPFTVRAADGTDSAYRYTALQNQAAGTSTNITTSLVGWEWDARVANGFEPPRVKTTSATTVNGNLIQNNGASYTTGSTTSNSAKYTAASGALVFATGTNHWGRGLALNVDGEGEPDLRIQQTTTNVLEDMGAVPATPAPSIVLDNPADPRVASTSPQDAETNVPITTKVTATFATDMNAATITSSSFTLKQPGGTIVPATVAYDAANRTATLTPNAQLSNSVTYTAKLDATVKNVSGRSLPVAYSWIFTTIAPPTVLRINAGGPGYTATNGNVFVADQNFFGGSTNSTTAAISGTSDQTLYKTERWGSFGYAIPVTPGTYDIRLHFVEMYYAAPCAGKRIFSIDVGDTPANPDLPNLDICGQVGANGALVKTLIGVSLSDGFLNIQSIYGTLDDPQIAAIEVYPSASSPGTPPSVITTNPADGATNVGTATPVKATFSRALDASTVTSSSFTLKTPAGATVPATVSYDGPSATATLTPNAALASSTVYTARLESSIKASDGTAMASAYTWTFTTSAPATPAPVRINAGGPAYTTSGGTSFLADQQFTGGGTFSSTRAISGTTDQALYQNERWGQFSYAIPVVNGTYDVRMHFVELYYGTSAPGGAGKRVFGMDILDTPGIDVQNLDIYSQAGANAALVKTVSGVSVTDGVVNIQSVYGSADDPEVAAIEIVPSSGPPPPPGAPTVTSTSPAGGATNVGTAATVQATFSTTMDAATITGTSYTLKKADGTTVPASVAYDGPSKTAILTPSSALASSTTYTARLDTTVKASDGTPLASAYSWSFTTSTPASAAAVRINSGGGAYTDSSGNTFLADQYFSGGNTFSSSHAIGGTSDQALYQNERWGAFSYAIPVVNGTYDVKLHFVELYYGTSVPGGTGKRVFSADVVDTPTSPDISNLDIYSQVGANTALVKTISGVGVTDGVLNIQSVYGSADDPEVAAIEVIPSSGQPPPPPPLDQTGQWSAPFAWPGVAVHMSLLPTGNVISWDGFAAAPNSERIWNPSTAAFTPVPYGRNLFCAGHVTLADGRTFIAGGHIAADNGLADTTIFDSSTNSWIRVPDMSVGRWYPTATELADGRVLVFAGDNIVQNRAGQPPPFSDASVNSLPEIFDPTTNTWTDLTGSKLTSPLYPFMFALSNGKVLNAGPDTTTRTFDPQTGAWATIGTSPFDGMSAVMYRPDKIMKSGTWADPDFNGALAYNSNNRTAVLDMTQPSPAWRETAPMAFPRSYHNLTLLPDGTVLASGGMSGSDGIDLGKAVLPAEIWNPDTETWKTVASLSNGREYHSTALLLLDGRILMAGGGQLPGTAAVDQNNGEIYSPPYLFKGARPTISAAPTLVQYGSTFTVSTPDAANIASVSLIRTPSVTHGFDQNQRFQWLSFTKNSGSLTVQAPAAANTAPPGYYMLFVVNTNGVPSIAKLVRFPAASEDTVPPSAPTNLGATGGVGTATLSWTAATDNVGVAKYSVYRSATSGFTPDVGNRIGQTTSTSYTDTGVTPGIYYYRVKAEDAVGNLGPASNEASAASTADTTAPTVSITAPSNGATVSASVAVTANATDDVGVAGVQFRLDGANLGAEDTTSPYSLTWDTSTATNGSHTLTAVARDAANNATPSSPVAVTVSNTAPPPPSGLVLAYSFDQGSGTTVPDSSGKGNTGTLASTTWSTAGKYGGALIFNGSSSWVTAADNATLDLTNGMTLEGWVSPTAAGTVWRTVIIKQSTNALVYSLYANTNTSRPSGHVFTSTEFDTRGTSAVPLNAWSFLAATYDGATLRFYVNGTQVSSKAVTGSMPNSTGALRIGGNSIWGEYFAGLIDNVRVYNRALSASEIQTDMNTRVP
jgi:fibronectin type 3 domain-containing protein